jgi:O-antigen/teichoic acid export membrane protein
VRTFGWLFLSGELERPLSNNSAAIASGVISDPTPSLRFSALARDVVTMGSGTVLTAVFNTALVFVIPPLVSVEDFGYWRLFILYGSYAGFLHLGLSDGALLRWAGKPLDKFHHEIAPSFTFLLWQLLTLIVPACLIIAFAVSSSMKVIGISTLIFALIMNLSTLLQYSLQAARQFSTVAIATLAPTGVFLILTVILNLRRVPGFRGLIVLYCVSWAGALLYLWLRVRPLEASDVLVSRWALAKSCLLLGWPVVLANGGFTLVQSADRLAVSSILPIYDFAQYSLASSMMFIPATAIAAVYRVFFSHVAAVKHEDRATVYAHASRFLLLAWSLLLPYYFLLEIIVRRFLQKYLAALPVAGLLLLGVLFLAGIQVLHMSFAYIYGKQRQFLFLTVGVLMASFTVGLFTTFYYRSLIAVAGGQVIVLAIWWLINEWFLRKITGQKWKDWALILITFVWSSAGFAVAMAYTKNPLFRTLIYYAMVSLFLMVACRSELRITWKLLTRSSGATASAQ